jgi:hypothetical protein
MKITKQVQIIFEEDTTHGKFSDALYFPLDDFDKIKDKEIEEKAQVRIDNFITQCEVEKPELTEEEKQKELQGQKISLEGEIALKQQEILDLKQQKTEVEELLTINLE